MKKKMLFSYKKYISLLLFCIIIGFCSACSAIGLPEKDPVERSVPIMRMEKREKSQIFISNIKLLQKPLIFPIPVRKSAHCPLRKIWK